MNGFLVLLRLLGHMGLESDFIRAEIEANTCLKIKILQGEPLDQEDFPLYLLFPVANEIRREQNLSPYEEKLIVLTENE